MQQPAPNDPSAADQTPPAGPKKSRRRTKAAPTPAEEIAQHEAALAARMDELFRTPTGRP